MACDFMIQLSKLRKLSVESVDNTDRFDSFKEYIHVERHIENELKELLRRVNAYNKKCLVLLCGSAGDGKSHLISYLKYSDPEKLLEEYEPYNDATESSEPQLTSIDTLASRLAPFNDENYSVDDGKKMIVAINLGTLNNFIESESAKKFTYLQRYVEDHAIVSGYSKGNCYKEDSIFQHVNFSDYQVFGLTENGIETEFLENLIQKVFCKSDNNPFYQAYRESKTCTMCQRCPVRHNYEFLSEVRYQKVIIHRIVEAIIKDKIVVSTRDVLNLIYDLIIHPKFDYDTLCHFGTSDIEYLMNYILWSTPMLMNEYEDLSLLLNAIRSHDILKGKHEFLDEDVTRFHSLENVGDIFEKATEGTPYQILSTLTDVSNLGAMKPELKKVLYRFIARLRGMREDSVQSLDQERFRNYIQYLYYQNSGNEKKLTKLYDTTKRAVLSWDGKFGDDLICIDGSNEQYWILEQLQLKSAIYKNNILSDKVIQQFSPTIKLRYKRESLNSEETVEVNIDFALFELIEDMREGYRPTLQDKNRHTDFVSFIQKIIEFGNKKSRIIIVPKDSGKKYKIVFEENDFGYEFRVV